MTWNPITDPIDYVLVAGKKSPGIATILGASSPRRWDERKGYGLSGAFVVFRGLGLSKWTVQLRLYTEEDWRTWDEWKEVVKKPPVSAQGDLGFFRRPRALDIWHPILEDLGIKSAVVEDLLQPLQTADGEWTIEIKMIEFRRPEFNLAKPEGSEKEVTDPVDAYIEDKRAQNAQLRAERDAALEGFE